MAISQRVSETKLRQNRRRGDMGRRRSTGKGGPWIRRGINGEQEDRSIWTKDDHLGQVSREASKGKGKTGEQVPNPKGGAGMNLP